MIRGIRGAITVKNNTKEEILAATENLLKEIVEENGLVEEKMASIFFSLTTDLDAAFPAVAARNIGFEQVALFCTQELDIQGGLEKCIRVLIHYNTDVKQKDIKHIYLRQAKKLRPDLVGGE